MSQVIVIDSSDDEGGGEAEATKNNTVLDDTVENSELAKQEKLFNEFFELSRNVIKENENGKKILNYLETRHKQAAQHFKFSRPYRKVLQSSISKLKTDSKDVYVHVHNVILTLDKNRVGANNETGEGRKHFLTAKSHSEPGKRCRMSSEVDKTNDTIYSDCIDEPSTSTAMDSGEPYTAGNHEKRRRVSLETVERDDEPSTSAALDSGEPYSVGNQEKRRRVSLETVERDDAIDSGGIDKPSTSTASDQGEQSRGNAEEERELRRGRRIKKLEILLKKISSEIIRLQSEELTLDDLDKEDTSYIQESNLKRRFMQIYKEICRLKKSSPLTGRMVERKIRVSASRFPEINRKVEIYINNPKREFNLPDFQDVYHLVKQASIKNNLGLGNNQAESIARCIFGQIGEKWQKRRHLDFVFEFGSSAVDNDKDLPDPASNDSELSKRLAQNRVAARQNLESVIQKYLSMQEEIGEREPENPALKEDDGASEEDDSNSDVEIVSFVKAPSGETSDEEKTTRSDTSAPNGDG